MDNQKRQCIEFETEYREWSKNPLWYCVKTLFNPDSGKTKSEIIKDEKTELPIVIRDKEKPQDAVFETPAGTVYYTYCRGYKEAAKQVAAMTI